MSKQPTRYKSGFGTFPKPKKPKSERRLTWERALEGDPVALALLKRCGVTKWVHKGKQIV